MQQEWIAPVVGLSLAFLFVLFLIVAMARARARRRAELEGPDEGSEALPEPVAKEPLPGGDGAAAPAEDLEVAAPEALSSEPRLEKKPEPEVRDEALARGLQKTHASFWSKLSGVLGGQQIDAKVLDELEDALLTADVGVQLSMRLVDDLRGQLKAQKLTSPEQVRGMLEQQITQALVDSSNGAGDGADPLEVIPMHKPRVILFVGVNGVGKTTSIGKIAAKLRAKGESVVLAAGDTFRAAAAEQLAIWGGRTGSHVIRGGEGADPASVIFNAIDHAKANKVDTVLADTAGRLHTKKELMDEIQKVKRAAQKARHGAPDETWLVVDATTGQNALAQAKEFHSALELSGVILTKLDGTAKGGIVIAISEALKIPVRFVGVGEKAEDLRLFEPRTFASALFHSP